MPGDQGVQRHAERLGEAPGRLEGQLAGASSLAALEPGDHSDGERRQSLEVVLVPASRLAHEPDAAAEVSGERHRLKLACDSASAKRNVCAGISLAQLRSVRRSWDAMNRRCYVEKTAGFRCYGGRGIRVCERWRNSFEAFLEDMGPKPSSKHSIDRIDNDGDYTPENCRWATHKEQQRNKNSNRLYLWRGLRVTAAALAEMERVPYKALRARLKRGWDPEKAVSTAVREAGHCKAGHRLDGDNVNAHGRCRICHRLAQQLYWRRTHAGARP